MKVSTGVKDFDQLFNFDSELLTVLYGEPASGKTTLALLATIANAKKKVIYIDTENGFSTERLKQLAPNYKEFIENIIHIHPPTLEEQEKVILNLNEKSAPMIIVDTIGYHYRTEVKGDPYKANKSLDNQLKKLTELTKRGIFVLLINQVYSDMKGNVMIVGGEMMKNWSKMLIQLEKNPRAVRVEKPFELKIPFEIKHSGIFRREE